jgi:hypothetical protein
MAGVAEARAVGPRLANVLFVVVLVALSFFVNPAGAPAAHGFLLFVIGLFWFCVVAFASAVATGRALDARQSARTRPFFRGRVT